MWKRFAVMMLGVGVLFSARADAAPHSSWAVEGLLTHVAVTDKALEVSGSTELVLELVFSSAGSDCGTSRAAGETYQISSAVSTNSFNEFVKIAQAAYLSGRTLRYGTAKRTSTSTCAPWFLQLK